jgi:hypothetical protein
MMFVGVPLVSVNVMGNVTVTVPEKRLRVLELRRRVSESDGLSVRVAV